MTRLYRIVFHAFFICLQLLVLGINIAPASIGLKFLVLNKGTSCPVHTFFILYAVCAVLSSVCEVYALYTIQQQERRRQFPEPQDDDASEDQQPARDPDQRLQSSIVILLVILSSVFKWTCAIMALRLSMTWHSDQRAHDTCAEGTDEIVQLIGYISFFQTVSGFLVLVICARCVCMCCGPQPVAAEDDADPPIAPVKEYEMVDTPVASVIMWVKDGAVPPQFRCSLSNQVMKDPVVAADGYSYEREVIASRLEAGTDRLADGRALSPVTGRPLRHLELIPNHSLRSWISEWQAREAVKDEHEAAREPSPKKTPGKKCLLPEVLTVEKKKKTKLFDSPCSSGIKAAEDLAVSYDLEATTPNAAPSSSHFGSPNMLSRSAQLGFLTRTHSSMSANALRASLTSITSTTSHPDAASVTPPTLHTSCSVASSNDDDRTWTAQSVKSSGALSRSGSVASGLSRSGSIANGLSRSGSIASGLAAAVSSALAAASRSPFRRPASLTSLETAVAVVQRNTESSEPRRGAAEEEEEIEDSAYLDASPLPLVQVVIDSSPSKVLYCGPHTQAHGSHVA